MQWGYNKQKVGAWEKTHCIFPISFTQIYTLTTSADTSDVDFTGTGNAQTRVTTRGLANGVSGSGFYTQKAVNTYYIAIGT